MLYLNNNLDILEHTEKIISLTSNQIALKINNPNFKIVEKYKVPWQVMINDINENINYDYNNVVVISLIPQYFHNFYEIFPKLILLKQSGEKFIVIIVRPEEKTNGLFNSLIKNNIYAQCNATHMADFLNYIGISFICLTPEELLEQKYRSTYLFYDSGNYSDDDHNFLYLNKKYTISYFLKVPVPEILCENSLLLKNEFPKINIKNNKKILISRKKGNHRQYEYQDELEDCITEMGYKPILMEDLSLIEQIVYIQEAERIVVPYGSGLVNTVFCNKNKILSINYTKGYYVDTYDKMFDMYNIDYKNIDIFDNNIASIKNIILEWENNEK